MIDGIDFGINYDCKVGDALITSLISAREFFGSTYVDTGKANRIFVADLDNERIRKVGTFREAEQFYEGN